MRRITMLNPDNQVDRERFEEIKPAQTERGRDEGEAGVAVTAAATVDLVVGAAITTMATTTTAITITGTTTATRAVIPPVMHRVTQVTRLPRIADVHVEYPRRRPLRPAQPTTAAR